jgi:SET domain-containing protein
MNQQEIEIYHDYRDHGKTAVRPSEINGNGIFAREPIATGEVIERCRVILTDMGDDVKNSALYPYLFVWNETHFAVALGNAVLYNHSTTPNAEVRSDGDSTLVFVATKPIVEGEEILIDYT